MSKPMTPLEVRAVGSQALTLHPDGEPWTKCCSAPTDKISHEHCQCLMRKNRHNPKGSRHDYGKFYVLDELKAAGGRFICCHRTTKDGYYRECAGWAAKFSKNGHAKKTTPTSP